MEEKRQQSSILLLTKEGKQNKTQQSTDWLFASPLIPLSLVPHHFDLYFSITLPFFLAGLFLLYFTFNLSAELDYIREKKNTHTVETNKIIMYYTISKLKIFSVWKMHLSLLFQLVCVLFFFLTQISLPLFVLLRVCVLMSFGPKNRQRMLNSSFHMLVGHI